MLGQSVSAAVLCSTFPFSNSVVNRFNLFWVIWVKDEKTEADSCNNFCVGFSFISCDALHVYFVRIKFKAKSPIIRS